jgi:hypothetical protein
MVALRLLLNCSEPTLQVRKIRSAMLLLNDQVLHSSYSEIFMNFQVVALSETEFQPLYGLSDDDLARRGVLTTTALSSTGYPCRVSLRDADAGARMLLLNYEHQPANSPYRSTHAIYVQEGAVSAAVEVNTVPEVLRTRLLSVRAFDRNGMIVDADVVEGIEAASVFQRLLGNDKAAYLHVHNAKRGCYAARVDRVE